MNPAVVDWRRIVFPAVAPERVQQLSDELSQFDVVSVSVHPCNSSPVFDDPSSGEATALQMADVIVLIGHRQDSTALMTALEGRIGKLPDHHIEPLADRDWTTAWQADFPARLFGERLWVCRRDDEIETRGQAVVRIDPGQAFGTGSHATTAMCLEALCTRITDQARVIDYGCGSGILAIAAAKLGAESINAVDIDAQALRTTRDNALANKVADRIELSDPADLPGRQADLLVANILLRPLLALVPRFAELLKPDGVVLLSGLTRDQAEPCLAAYRPLFNMGQPQYADEWCLLTGSRHK